MFSDRLEVYSPGRLPGHVTLENIVDERYSRNEAIVAVLTDLGYIERLGYGHRPHDCHHARRRSARPHLRGDNRGFQGHPPVRQRQSSQRRAAETAVGAYYLNERQEQALAYIGEHGRITNSEYQALSPDVSAETLRRDLVDLVEKNLLLRIGEKRATYYILK